MKKRKQNVARFLCLLMVCTVLSCMAGCEGKGGSEPAQPALETVTYSNLTDADSRDLLSGLLEKSGVAESRIQVLLACVDQFNAAVKPAWLTDGFESAAPTETKYDVYDMQDVWTEKYGNFMGYNCRITAYSTETGAQVQALQEGWASRGVNFADSEAHLISVIFHDKFSDDENTLSVGHAGVLLPSEDGTLYFLEKVAFQEPYRLLKFQNRTELSDYLMEKYDTAWGQDTARPFIMENDALMDGFRQNPLEEAQT